MELGVFWFDGCSVIVVFKKDSIKANDNLYECNKHNFLVSLEVEFSLDEY